MFVHIYIWRVLCKTILGGDFFENLFYLEMHHFWHTDLYSGFAVQLRSVVWKPNPC